METTPPGLDRQAVAEATLMSELPAPAGEQEAEGEKDAVQEAEAKKDAVQEAEHEKSGRGAEDAGEGSEWRCNPMFDEVAGTGVPLSCSSLP